MRGVACSVMMGVLCALAAPAVAQPARIVVDVTRSLPAMFFFVTRQCKQSVAEIGSSLEKPDSDLVQQYESSGYIMVCRKAKDRPNRVVCTLHSSQTLLSSGKNTIDFDFMAYRAGGGPLVLQELLSGSAIYVNPGTGDAVTVSRQYIAGESTLMAHVKTCKAMLLNEDQFAKFAEGGE